MRALGAELGTGGRELGLGRAGPVAREGPADGVPEGHADGDAEGEEEQGGEVHAAMVSGGTDRMRAHRAAPPRLAAREPQHRNRRPAQRRQVHPVQRADQERRAGGELPVRDDRAQRRRGGRARSAAGGARRDLRLGRILPATVEFVDIAGIVRGASEGAGLGNKFLANIREADAICQVVRVFADPDVVHVDGEVSPAADIETINTELILADLQTLEKALPRLQKEARINKDRAEVAGRRRAGAGRPAARAHGLRRRARHASCSASCPC